MNVYLVNSRSGDLAGMGVLALIIRFFSADPSKGLPSLHILYRPAVSLFSFSDPPNLARNGFLTPHCNSFVERKEEGVLRFTAYRPECTPGSCGPSSTRPARGRRSERAPSLPLVRS